MEVVVPALKNNDYSYVEEDGMFNTIDVWIRENTIYKAVQPEIESIRFKLSLLNPNNPVDKVVYRF